MPLLTKILAIIALFGLLACGALFTAYRDANQEIGQLSIRVDQLTRDIESCRGDIELIEKDKTAIAESFEQVEKKNDELSDEFDKISNELKNKRCQSTRGKEIPSNELNTKTSSDAADIRDTIRLLNEANCVSNPRCKRA